MSKMQKKKSNLLNHKLPVHFDHTNNEIKIYIVFTEYCMSEYVDHHAHDVYIIKYHNTDDGKYHVSNA